MLRDTVGNRGRGAHKADWGGGGWSRKGSGRKTRGQGKKLLLEERNGQHSQMPLKVQSKKDWKASAHFI